MLGDVADNDARRCPEVDYSVATINTPEIFDELLAGVSVSERRAMETAPITHPVMGVEEAGERLKGQTPGLVPVRYLEQVWHKSSCAGWGQVPAQAVQSLTT